MEPLVLPNSPFPALPHSPPRRRPPLRRGAPMCVLGCLSHSDSFHLAAAAALSVLRVASRRRGRAIEFCATGISSNIFEKNGGLEQDHVDPEFNVEIPEKRTTHLALSTHDMGSKSSEHFEKNDQGDLELQRESSLKVEDLDIEMTKEVISAHLPEFTIETRNIELDDMKELLVENQGNREEIAVFKDLKEHHCQNSIAPQVNKTNAEISGDNLLDNDENIVRGPQVATSNLLLKPPIKSSYSLDPESHASHMPISLPENQSQVMGEFSLHDRSGFDSEPYSSRSSQTVRHGSTLAEDKPLELVSSSFEGASSGRKEIRHYRIGGKEKSNIRSLDRNNLAFCDRKHVEIKIERNLPNGATVEDVSDVTLCLNRYNHLLREGRLIECVVLLENMEMKGLLDMDKIYHVRFLKTCKAQKAVEEAFRFTRLIKNPTLSTYNMLLSVCASAQNCNGASQVLQLVKNAGLKPDCQLYTTLISTCGKSGKVDAMFEIFHEMANAGVEPNLHTYGALIDGCARAGQVAKAFGAYGIMRSKNLEPDRVIFNTLITACGQSGAARRAFDVLSEMMAEPQLINPDHVTVGALMKTCIQTGQADRVREVYQMLQKFEIKGTADVYTIAVSSCSLTGNLEFAFEIYDDMRKNNIVPDEMFLSTIIDVAGHAGKVDVAFDILRDAKLRGVKLGIITYSSLMGACSKAKSWQKALQLYEDIISHKLQLTTSTVNALITSLCDGDQLLKAVEILQETRIAGVHPDVITYSVLIVACEKKDEIELGIDLFSQAKGDGIPPNLTMCRCLTDLCLKRYMKACARGEPVLSFNSKGPWIDCKWLNWALMVYRETISAGLIPSSDVFSQVLGCLKFPNNISLRKRLVENLGINVDNLRQSSLNSLLDGFGEYDPRAFAICEEASSLGVVLCVSCEDDPIVVDVRKLQFHLAEVYLLTVLKAIKHHLAAGAKLPNLVILLPTEKTQVFINGGKRTINLSGRVGQVIIALLRRLGLPRRGDNGKITIDGLTLRRWFKPKIDFESFGGTPSHLTYSQPRLAKEIADQQRRIRSDSNFFLS